MTNKKLKTKGQSHTDEIEEMSKRVLMSKLPLSDALFVWYGDKYPNVDGHIEFLDENGSTAIRLYFQLKGSMKDIAYYKCDRSFLYYCFKANEPTFLVFVNIPQQIVYWEHISQKYITSELGIRDISKFVQKTKRIKFVGNKIIDKNVKVLADICKNHYQEIPESRISIQEETIKAEPILIQKAAVAEDRKKIANAYRGVEEKFSHMLGNLLDKFLQYYSFVFLLKPFYLDRRGEISRRKILRYLKISDSEERSIIESLVSGDFVRRTGDLIFVTRREDAIAVLNHYINKGEIDINEITQLLLNDDFEDQ